MAAKIINLEEERKRRGLPPAVILIEAEVLADVIKDAKLAKFQSMLVQNGEPEENEIVP